MRILLSFFVLLLYFPMGWAQQSVAEPPLPDLPLALAYLEPNLPEGLSEEDGRWMAHRLARLCVSGHFLASSLDHNFAIAPQLYVLEARTLNGLRPLQFVEVEFSVSIRQQAGGISFGSYQWLVSGEGRTQREAIRAALRTLPVRDDGFAGFLKGIRPKINAYYATNCAALIRNADRRLTVGDYEGTLLELSKVPAEAEACGETVEEKWRAAYKAYQREYCGPLLRQAQAALARRQTAAALDLLIQISPDSPCGPEADRLIRGIDNRQSRAEQAKLEFTRALYTDQLDARRQDRRLRIQRWITVAEIAKATAAVVGGFSPSLNVPIYLGQ